jgi:RimJ/RimL family protein N-acetyltransferase
MPVIELSSISLQELRPLIAYAYLEDNDLIERFQADTARTYDQCVEYNYKEIKAHIEDPVFKGDVRLWKIEANSEGGHKAIGYCVTVENDDRPHMLLSYSINKAYRKAEYLVPWLQRVEEKLGVPYYTGLWNKNTRAINFFEKNGFKKFEAQDMEYSYLVKNPELLKIKMFAI